MRNDVPTMRPGPAGACAVQGRVRWSPSKSAWWFAMAAGTVLALTTHFSYGGLLLGLGTVAVTLCLGHSLGMHRRFIHRSYAAPLWLERLFVYLGTLVGMAGPLGMMRTHDLRDWAQRQSECHDYFALGWWITGAISFGECWHNNHRAFPASSRIGHATHELDPGWWVLLALRRAGLVSALALPGDLPHRPELRPMRGAPSMDPLMLRERSAHER